MFGGGAMTVDTAGSAPSWAEMRKVRCKLDEQVDPEMAWKSDVALELWIDSVGSSVTIRLAGFLDHATGQRFLAVVSELISLGHREFDLQTGELFVCGSLGEAVLVEAKRLISESGGPMAWDGATSLGARSA